MKRLLKITLRFLRRHNIPIFIFLFMLFRPQILFYIRHEWIRSDKNTIVPPALNGDENQRSKKSAEPVAHAGFFRSDDSDEDGCGDDGSCSEDQGSDGALEEDYSGDDGCSGCESESDPYYTGEEQPSNDDGCSCAGETVVTSSNTYSYNGTLRIILNMTAIGSSYKLYITDAAGKTLFTFFTNTTFGNGVYEYRWNGYDSGGRIIDEGYYKAILETENAPYVRREKVFYYSTTRGFEVGDASEPVIEFDQ